MSPSMLALSLLTFSDLLLIMPPLAAHALKIKARADKTKRREKLILMLQIRLLLRES